MPQKIQNQYDIIHIVRIFHPNIGGMENLVHEIADRQVNLGKKVLVITSDLKRDGEKVVTDLKRNYEIFRVKSFLFKGIFLPTELFGKLPECKLLHCHGMDPLVDFLTFKIKFDELVISPHGGFFHTLNMLLFKKIYFYSISKLIARMNPKYMCISQNDIELVSKLSDNVHFMGCGSSDVKFSLAKSGVVTFGRISPNKCINDAIDVFRNNFPQENLIIAGPNPEGIKINIVQNVEYLGPVSSAELEDLIEKSKYFISMSSYEGLGMALIEAIKGGLIPVVREIDSYVHIDQLIREKTGGESTIIFVNSIDDANDEIHKVYSEKQLKLCAEAANEIWCWDRVVEKLNT